MRRILIFLLFSVFCLESTFAQTDSTATQSDKSKKSKIRTGVADSTKTNIKPPITVNPTIEKTVNIDSLSKKDTAKTDIAKADSTTARKPRKHSPLLASLLSTAVPGAGQIYNGRWWKTPIAWGLVGGLGYWMLSERKKFKDYRRGYIYKTDGDATTIDPYPNIISSTLKSKRDLARSNFEKAAIFTALAWSFNILDAFVDAHLKGFDISDDLSMKIKPKFSPANDIFHDYSKINIGIGLSFNFR